MDTKFCSSCKFDKPMSEFNVHRRSKDGLSPYCKECNKEYHRKHYQRNKQDYHAKAAAQKRSVAEWYRELKKGLKCELCGEDHPACLDFHHKDPSQKEAHVARIAANSGSKKKILAEIAKCHVWCCRCHRKWHWENDEKK